MTMTITEALAEIKLLTKRHASEHQFVMQNLYRQDAYKDPHLNDGGSEEVISRKLQSLAHLRERIVKIRSAINHVNASKFLVIEGVERTVADWIIWRREVAPLENQALSQMASQIASARQQAQQKGLSVRGPGEEAQAINDLHINLSEADLQEDRTRLETILGRLDGQLSLANATTYVVV